MDRVWVTKLGKKEKPGGRKECEKENLHCQKKRKRKGEIHKFSLLRKNGGPLS